MRAVLQRVREASLTVAEELAATIGPGLVVLLGIGATDAAEVAERLAARVARLRVFENEEGRLDRSLLDVGGEALVVSQFTLIADGKRQRGARPDFSKAARPEVAEPLYDHFVHALRDLGVPVQTGVFGARMEVSLVNDGPVTIVLDL